MIEIHGLKNVLRPSSQTDLCGKEPGECPPRVDWVGDVGSFFLGGHMTSHHITSYQLMSTHITSSHLFFFFLKI